MAWLRLDDGFAGHRKLEGWSVGQKWAWLELLLWCAHHRTSGRVPADLAQLPRSVTRSLLNRAEASGLLDLREGELWVHDWELYNPKDATGAQRSERYRRRHASDRDANRDATVTSRAGARGDPTPPLDPTPEDQDPGLPSSESSVVADDSAQHGTFKIPKNVLRDVR